MGALLKNFIDGYLDLFTFAPFCPPADSRDAGEVPGPAQDAANLAADWQRVGDYFRNAMATADAEINSPEL